MNTSTPIVEPTSAAEVGDVDQRGAALLEELRASDPSQSAGEVEEGGESRPAAAPPTVASPADLDAQARRAERQKRLEAMRLETRQAVDHKERQAFAEKAAARAKEAEDRVAQLTGTTFDKAVLKDPVAVMRMMEAEGVTADKVADAIRESLSDPTIAASRKAREAISPELVAMRQQLEAQNKQIAALLERDQKASATAAEARHREHFVQHVESISTRTPLAAALLKHDREEFLQMADLASDKVPPGAGKDALADALEDLLDTDVRAVATKYQAIYGGSPAATTPTSQATQPRPGAVQPRTVSNSLGSERGSIVDEEDWARLPVEERARRLSR